MLVNKLAKSIIFLVLSCFLFFNFASISLAQSSSPYTVACNCYHNGYSPGAKPAKSRCIVSITAAQDCADLCNPSRPHYYTADVETCKTGEVCKDVDIPVVCELEGEGFSLDPEDRKEYADEPEVNLEVALPGQTSVLGMRGWIAAIYQYIALLIAIVAVVMIIYAGFRWTTALGNSSQIAKAKDIITNAVIGLVLVLTSYLILYTVNPSLVNFSRLRIPMIPSPSAPASSKDAIAFENTIDVGGIRVAKNIRGNLEKLLQSALGAGFKLTGSGWRSYLQQVELRRENCGPSHYEIYDMPSGQCHPPTARPGHSNHEMGLAIDFKCNGGSMTRESACFKWLEANAADFGFYNLPSEPWHWSTDGK